MHGIALLKPPALQRGDTIGIVAPSRPVLEPGQYRQGKEVLRAFGFHLREGRTVRLRSGWMAGTPLQQAADIHRMFVAPEVKGIIAQAGGASAIRTLPHLDYDLIAQHPKPFIGMSDVTSYHLALYTRCGLVGFHMDDLSFGLGLSFPQASPAIQGLAADLYVRLLTQPEPLGEVPGWLGQRVAWRGGRAQGPLIGGCLQVMCRLLGTPFFPPLQAFEGALLFWEEIGLSLSAIDRLLWQLRLAGVLERIAGMLIGTVHQADEAIAVERMPTLREVVLEATDGYNYPILAGLEFGHAIVNIPMPLGVRASMDADRGIFALLEPAVV
ncbi:MAG: LD-carboxypeptidase [Anaerolineae bacterium]|nr:LD-carboxypeptidase [Anaerolineae bacterium]